jgi:hypothetical protein
MCERIQRTVGEDTQFLGMMFWTNDVLFKMNGTVNRHNCLYWSSENPNVRVDKAVNIPALSVWCGVSSGVFWDCTLKGQ